MSVKQVLENIDLLSLILSFLEYADARVAQVGTIWNRAWNTTNATRRGLRPLTGPHPNPTSNGTLTTAEAPSPSRPRLVTRRMRRRLVERVHPRRGAHLHAFSIVVHHRHPVKYTFAREAVWWATDPPPIPGMLALSPRRIFVTALRTSEHVIR